MKVHNDARREVGTPPLQWDNKLANEAQQFANYLASTGEFKHASEFPAWKRDMGENLALNYDANPAKMAAEQWFGEKAAFQRLGTNGKLLSAHVKNWSIFKDIGHYTQMVWQDTTKAGSGKAQYTAGPNKGGWIVVGKYAPGGNYTDRFAYGTPNAAAAANNVGGGTGAKGQMDVAKSNGKLPEKSTFTQGDAQVTIKVTNNTGKPVAYEWVNYEGKAEPQKQMSTLGVTLFSYPGNLYRFKVGGATKSYRVTKAAKQTYVIGSPSNKAVATGNNRPANNKPANKRKPGNSSMATPAWAANQTKSTWAQGEPKLAIFITNNTGKALESHWVDGSGKESAPGTVPAGAKKLPLGTSYPGNLYRFKINGKLRHSWVIQKGNPHLVIGSPAKNTASAGGAKATPAWAANQTKSTWKQGAGKVTISVTNKTGKVLESHWVDGNGKESAPGSVPANAKKLVLGTSYPGNLYRFKINGKLKHSWVIEANNTHLIIE